MVRQRLQRCNFVRMLIVLGNDVLHHASGGSGSYWTHMPADIRKLLLEHVCNVWPAMGKTRRQMRQFARFLMQKKNIKHVCKLLSGSSVGGFQVVEKVNSGAFEIRQGGGSAQ